MKHLYIIYIVSFLSFTSLYAQTLEGLFTYQGKEEVEDGSITLTAVGGQPFAGTDEEGLLSYGFIEMVSTENEYTKVSSFILDVEEEGVALEVGEPFQLTLTNPLEGMENTLFSWSSSDPSVAEVDENGNVTALSAGTVTISVVSACGVYASECTMVVTKSDPDPDPDPTPTPDPDPAPSPDPTPEPTPVYVSGVTMDHSEATLEIGGTLKLAATISPADADNKRVFWSSSDETVATVVDGTVTAHAAGTCEIRVVTDDGGYSAVCEVTVLSNATSVEALEGKERIWLLKDHLYADLYEAQVLYIIDVTGAICEQVRCQPGLNTIPMYAYPSGIYFVRTKNTVVKAMKR